jgi:hypothetical protein
MNAANNMVFANPEAAASIRQVRLFAGVHQVTEQRQMGSVST